MKKYLIKITALLLMLLLSAPVAYGGKKAVEAVDEEYGQPVERESFHQGYKYFNKENYKKASPFLFNYITKNSRDIDDYEWAEFFLGISLKNMGFTHASVESLSYLVTRKPNTKIVTYVLELFEEVTRTAPYDEGLLINTAVVDQDYSFVDSGITDFISYYQGVFDWENGFKEWGNNHFSKIQKDSYYYYKYLYYSSLYKLMDNKLDEAIEIQTTIIEADFQGEILKNEVRKTLARLLYEKKEYQGAEHVYDTISENILTQAQNLLERAWSYYRLGKYEKSMGLLYSLKAPVYKDYITPEYFMLKSVIYKDLCQYKKANEVIDEFREHYKNGLAGVYKRGAVADNHSLLTSIIQNRKINRLWLFLNQLENENRLIKKVNDAQLKQHLEKIYSLKISDTVKEMNRLIKDRYEIVANDLLEYEEKADLMSYEIGLAMYQRVYERHYIGDDKNNEDDNHSEGVVEVFFPFQGEYWTDEFTKYEVSLEDKCDCNQEWDIFFK